MSSSWKTQENHLALFTKAEKIHLSFGPSISILTKMCTYVYQKTDEMFIEEFFISAASKKLLKCPSVGD